MVGPFNPSDRDATLDQVLQLTQSDPRIEAAVITGSVAAGRADRWSDIDLDFVVVDGESCEAVATDWVSRLYEELRVGGTGGPNGGTGNQAR